jgi:hypothetical protein
MLTDLQEAIAHMFASGWLTEPEDAAEVVVAMPQMEAIRKALWKAACVAADNYGISTNDAASILADEFELPDDVVAWVVAGRED